MKKRKTLREIAGRPLYPFPWEFDRHRYSDFYLMACVSESQVQQNIVQLLKTYWIDAVPIDAGGRRARGRVAAVASSLGVEPGAFANARRGGEIPRGFSDLEATLAPSGRALYIEVKAPAWYSPNSCVRAAGRASQDQLAFLLEKHKRGAIVLVAWSAQDVKEYLGPLLVENRKALAG